MVNCMIIQKYLLSLRNRKIILQAWPHDCFGQWNVSGTNMKHFQKKVYEASFNLPLLFALYCETSISQVDAALSF